MLSILLGLVIGLLLALLAMFFVSPRKQILNLSKDVSFNSLVDFDAPNNCRTSLHGMFTDTQIIFTTNTPPSSSDLIYFEMSVEKIYKSFTKPLVLSFWDDTCEQKCDPKALWYQKAPFSAALMTNKSHSSREPVLGAFVKGERDIVEGDVIGIGLFLNSSKKRIMFLTLNGKLMGSYTCTTNTARNRDFTLVILTGCAFAVPQMDVVIKRTKKNFQFDLQAFTEAECLSCEGATFMEFLLTQRECGHSFCQSCGRVEISKSGYGRHTEPQCVICRKTSLNNYIRERCVLPDEHAMLEYNLQRSLLKKNSDCLFCPYPDCQGYVIVKESMSAPQALCNKCNELICVKCRTQWHPSMSCRKYQQKQKQEKKEKVLKKENFKCKKCHRTNTKHKDAISLGLCKFCGESYFHVSPVRLVCAAAKDKFSEMVGQ